jgi:hypothetical protein
LLFDKRHLGWCDLTEELLDLFVNRLLRPHAITPRNDRRKLV